MNLAMIALGGIGNDAQSVQENLAMRRCFYRCGWKYKRLTETVRPWRPEVGTLPYRGKVPKQATTTARRTARC
jgi:hypothetical protein